VTIFMVIVIINLLGLFMPRARIKGGSGRRRTRWRLGAGGGREGGRVGIPSPSPGIERRSEITPCKSDGR
jgi:hypothetical protein